MAKSNYFQIEGPKTFEWMDLECPACYSSLHREMATPIGAKLEIRCFTCGLRASAKSVESAFEILAQEVDSLAAEKANKAFHLEFPKGDTTDYYER